MIINFHIIYEKRTSKKYFNRWDNNRNYFVFIKFCKQLSKPLLLNNLLCITYFANMFSKLEEIIMSHSQQTTVVTNIHSKNENQI